MPKQDSSLLDMLAKHPIFGWMRPKPREDGGDDDGEGGASMFCEPRPASTKRSSSPILLSLSERDSGALRTAPVSTCASNISTTCWSDQAITSNAVVGSSSSNSSTEEEEAVPTFQRLGFPEKARKAPKRPNLKIAALDSAPPVESSTPAAAAATPLVAIPWRLIDPDLATTPLEKVRQYIELISRPAHETFIFSSVYRWLLLKIVLRSSNVNKKRYTRTHTHTRTRHHNAYDTPRLFFLPPLDVLQLARPPFPSWSLFDARRLTTSFVRKPSDPYVSKATSSQVFKMPASPSLLQSKSTAAGRVVQCDATRTEADRSNFGCACMATRTSHLISLSHM